MSYTKPDGTIIYSFSKEYLFKEVYLITSYKGRSIVGESGKSHVDEVALSEDERDAFDTNMEDGIDIVLKRIMRLATAGTYHENNDTNITFTIKDNQAYNENSVRFIDRMIKDVLIFSILKGWYKLIGLGEEEKKSHADLVNAERLLNNGTFDLRKVLLI